MNNFNLFNQPGMGAGLIHQDLFSKLSNDELLEQVKAMVAYGDHNHTTMMLLGELYQRASRAFSFSVRPTVDIQGTGYLYTTTLRDGILSHYFVDNVEYKDTIDNIFRETVVARDNKDPDVPGRLTAERIRRLTDLGDIFRVAELTPQGLRTYRAGFSHLFVGKGFNKDPQHPSLTLPRAVIEIPFFQLHAMSGTGGLAQFIESAANAFGLTAAEADILIKYIRTRDVVKGYENSITEDHTYAVKNNRHEMFMVQIHLFPAGTEVPIRIVGGCENKDWDAGFVNRAEYPKLFINPYQMTPAAYPGNAFNPGTPWGFGNPGM